MHSCTRKQNADGRLPFLMKRTAYLRPEREKARALDGAPRIGRGGMGQRQQQRDEDGCRVGALVEERGAERAMWVLGFGHVLFQCPPVVMAFVNHWMSWRLFNHESVSADSMSCEEAFDRLLYAVVNDGVDLQIRLERVEDRLRATTRVSYELSTMYNGETSRLSDFACSADVLEHACAALGGAMPEIRLRTLICYLFASQERPLFSHSEESPDSNMTLFSNFADNELLEYCQDRSAAFVAIGVYLVNYLSQASEKTESAGADKQDMARLEAGQALLKQYEAFVEQLHERCAALSRRRSTVLPEALRVYRVQSEWHEVCDDSGKEEEEEDSTCCGIQREVVDYELHTFLWLKWAWGEFVVTGQQSIRQLLRDLWYAKSVALVERYDAFFVDERFDTHIMAVAQRVGKDTAL